MTALLVPLTPVLSVQVDRLIDVDQELGRRVRDVLVADNLAAFLPDPSPETIAAARTCTGILIAGRAARARRLAEIRTAWATPREAAP